jgi:glutaredoxin
MSGDFTPILYVKSSCPHCFKLRLFLLEAGLIDRFEIHEFSAGDEREAAIKAELAPHLDGVSFPTVQYAPGQFQMESDDIVARYASEAQVDPSDLPLFSVYAGTLLPRLRRLNQENKALVAQLAAAGGTTEGS